MTSLPGAADPRYVQSDAVWSPDGQYLVFARALARDAYPPGRQAAGCAGGPNEFPMQYDLYRVPFHNGQGGRAEAIAGVSRNGMSNTFPKVSPDGRWIVDVRCRNPLPRRPPPACRAAPGLASPRFRRRAATTSSRPRFADAAATARRAQGLAAEQGNPSLAELLRTRVTLYERGAPLRVR